MVYGQFVSSDPATVEVSVLLWIKVLDGCYLDSRRCVASGPYPFDEDGRHYTDGEDH